MSYKTYAIRGAITVDTDTKEEIVGNSVLLLKSIIEKNSVMHDEAVSLMISTTSDITSFYPAAAVRESKLLEVPLFSCMEPQIDGALKLCIRFMLTVQKSGEFTPSHIYLNNAKTLRPDIK